MHTKDDMVKFIHMLAKAPKNTLDSDLAKTCVEFTDGDPVVFLRNMRDLCVRYAKSTAFVVSAISLVLHDYPEDKDTQEARHKELETKYEQQY